jgi:predicted extracellular nuclease
LTNNYILFTFKVLVCLLPSSCLPLPGPSDGAAPSGQVASGLTTERLRIVFYNVENLFDTVNNPDKRDDQFTPEGDRRWNYFRLKHKINNIYKALAAAGKWESPAIIGLCEVENRYVLELLTLDTGFKSAGYEIVHRNSADNRGIDVAILYRTDKFFLLDEKFIPVNFPFDTVARTRDIVYVKGIAGIDDTLHIFANHWPSRWGGQAATERYRLYAASLLRSYTDSLFQKNSDAKIVIMGDFNDEPGDISLVEGLGAADGYNNPEAGTLYNISREIRRRKQGSYKYQGEWFLLDQFIVSGSLLDGKDGLQTCPQSVTVFSAGFLLVADERWFGYKPFRSYEGFRYTGGFSDHLPVVLDLWW